MSFPETLLDVSWSIQYVPNEHCRDQSLHDLLAATSITRAASKLDELSMHCYRYMQNRIRSDPQDDLNDEAARTGQLNECIVTRIASGDPPQRNNTKTGTVGLLIQSRHQKVAYFVVLLARSDAGASDCPVVAVLYKSSQRNLKHIKGWLEEEFSLPASKPLDLVPQTLAQICSRYVLNTMQVPRSNEPLRIATIKQVIGNLRLTITFTSSGMGPAPKLKTMEIDVPAESIVLIQQKMASANADNDDESNVDDEESFLEQLAEALHRKTGLKLPLTGEAVEPEVAEDEDNPVAQGSPMKVTKITCAAFAISADGRIKFARKPVGNAEDIGYPVSIVTSAHYHCLKSICSEAEARAGGDAE